MCVCVFATVQEQHEKLHRNNKKKNNNNNSKNNHHGADAKWMFPARCLSVSISLSRSLLLTLSFCVCMSAYGCVRTCVNDFYFSECKGSGTYCTQRTAAACCFCCYGCYRWGIRLGSEKKNRLQQAAQRDALRRWWWQAKKKTWGGINDRDGMGRDGTEESGGWVAYLL